MIDDVYGVEGPTKGSKTGDILKAIGGGIAGNIGPVAGALYSMFGPSRDTLRREQREDQQEFTNMQVNANKDLASYTSGLQFDMMNKTAAPWQVEKLKEAGLNPALMYGTSGGGGGTTGSASAGSASSGQAASSAATRANEIGMGMQLAQMGLMTAQAEKTKAETEKIKGADTELAKAQTGKTTTETGLANIQLEVAGKTREAAIQTIEETAARALAEAVQAQQKQVITEQTMQEQISKIKTEAIGAIIENEVKRSGVNLNNARIKEIAANIEQRWKGQDIDVENNKRMTEAMLWGAGIHAAGNLVNSIMGIATKGKLQGKKGTKGKWDENENQMNDFNKAMGW